MRVDVLAVIDGELEYQKDKHGSDHYTSFGDFATYMRVHMTEMETALAKGDFTKAQDSLRKVTALGAAAMTRHGAAARSNKG